MSGDLQGAKPNLQRMRDLAERLRERTGSTTALALSAIASSFKGDWEAARLFLDQSLAVSSMDCQCLALRVQLEFELGEFDLGEVYLERLLDAMRLIPPGPNMEYMLPALVIPLAARVSGSTGHIEVAEAAADAVFSAANSIPLFVGGARAGLGFLVVQRRGFRWCRGPLCFSRPQPGDSGTVCLSL